MDKNGVKDLMSKTGIVDESLVGALLSVLTPKEECVLRMRYGIHEGYAYKKFTCAEIAAEFEVSISRIYQIEANAYKKLKRRNLWRWSKNHRDYRRLTSGHMAELADGWMPDWVKVP
jgi:DNA-directed RNA polymerase sigma subunit (sigma70/sigma32)